MSSQKCTLCELETPDPPIEENNIDGVFCCHGCLHVYKLLQDMEEDKARQLKNQTIELRKEGQTKTPLPESYEEAFFKVDGMHCATCESFLESIAKRQNGIYKSEASYTSEMIKIYYDQEQIGLEDFSDRLSKMGYNLRDLDTQADEDNGNDVVRIMIGGFFGIIGLLLYSLFFYPTYIGGEGLVPLTNAEQYFFISNIFVMTSFVLFYTGYPILRGAWVSILVLKPNMDLLIAIAAVSAYLYSFGALLTGSAEIYFDVTMAIVLVVSIGNFYERRIKSNKQSLLTKLSEQKLDHAFVQRNGHLEKVSIADITHDDKVIVKAGERIPVDGTIIDGEGVVNEALITGESQPVSKQTGNHVLSGTILTQNALTIKPDINTQRTIDQLMKLMWNIQSSRSGKQRLADRIAAYFVPVVIFLGIGTFGYHLFSGSTATNAMLAALAVLIVSCPCALGLATPLAIASGMRTGLENDIIFKSAALFEEETEADIVAFDKTGTLTTGKMHLLDRGSNQQALEYAAGLETFSSHPVAAPIAELNSNNEIEVQNFESFTSGVSGYIDDKKIYVGQPEWLEEQGIALNEFHSSKIEESRQQGNIPVGIGWDDNIRSILIVGDRLREEAPSVIASLQRQDKKIALITGDSSQAGEYIKKQLKPDFLFTEAKPESKSNIISNLRQMGIVAMAGDGSNDAPALAKADLGIAFGNLTAIAADSAQVVIPSSNLSLIPAAFTTIQKTKNRIRQNLGWAFLYNIITIPLAIAGIINPLFAAVAMAASSLLVVSNSSRKMEIKT
ncbi:Cu2+-exporting ATPase [Fodinibius salinus]|uniref:Cu2+-exporting ATPase n=1 Tax=Fodinibius salinus TaxID=860790 RepID=A0A5D3YKM7_9BACT|nr:heavy metal translocating P-type ATPase [Fodinibius salinus]TYP94068.1 Cu2+-exporting ATPase [Fodinibius salinus]